MDCHKEDTGVSIAIVNAMFAFELCKSPANHGLVHHAVPDQTFLLHSIKAVLELPDVILHADLNETLGLLHVAYLVRVEQTVKEGHSNAQPVDFLVKGGS